MIPVLTHDKIFNKDQRKNCLVVDIKPDVSDQNYLQHSIDKGPSLLSIEVTI